MSKHYVALNTIGDNISVVGFSWQRNGDYKLEGFVLSEAKGIENGVVSDISAAANSVRKAVTKLEKKTSRKYRDIYAGISSPSIEVMRSEGMVLLSKYGREVSSKDADMCVRIGSVVKMPLDRELLYRSIAGFFLDAERGIKKPIGLEGVKLGVEVNLITIASSVLHNLEKCISQAGYVFDGGVFSILAMSHRTLSEEDKNIGTALLNIRNNTTEAAVFNKGILEDCRVFKTGTDEIKTLAKHASKLSGWDKTHKIVVTGEGSFKADLIGEMEGVFHCPVSPGVCITKPFEDLPPERRGYIGSLGIIDHIHKERLSRPHATNRLKRLINKTWRFIDSYF